MEIQVKTIMEDTGTCLQYESLLSVAKKMLENDSSAVPIIGHNRKFIGMITDRDVTLALGKNERKTISELTVNDAMKAIAPAVAPEDDIASVLRIMRKKRIRNLPVVDREHRFRGMVSLPKIVRSINELNFSRINSQ